MLTTRVVGDGLLLCRPVVDADLEGIVAKRLADPYHPQRTRWHNVLNPVYSQRRLREAPGRGASSDPFRGRAASL